MRRHGVAPEKNSVIGIFTDPERRHKAGKLFWLVAKLVLMVAVLVFLALRLDGGADSEHRLFLVLGLTVLGGLFTAIILLWYFSSD